MKEFAHAHSSLIQNRQFRARIVRKECAGNFNQVAGEKEYFKKYIHPYTSTV